MYVFLAWVKHDLHPAPAFFVTVFFLLFLVSGLLVVVNHCTACAAAHEAADQSNLTVSPSLTNTCMNWTLLLIAADAAVHELVIMCFWPSVFFNCNGVARDSYPSAISLLNMTSIDSAQSKVHLTYSVQFLIGWQSWQSPALPQHRSLLQSSSGKLHLSCGCGWQ